MLSRFMRIFRDAPRRAGTGRPLGESGTPKLGLALSSGGARGLAHVGVLQVLEENGIEIHAISGASMGSYVAALWAAGFSGHELEELAGEMHERKQLWKLADPIIPPMKGLFRGLKGKAHLERSLGELRIENLERRLLIVSVDIDTKERIVLRKGRLSDAVHASCAMPGIIAPVHFEGRRCVDGGVVDPVPVGALQKFGKVDRIIAVSVLPSFDEVDEGRSDDYDTLPPSRSRRFLSFLNRRLNVMAAGNVVDTFRQSIRAAQIRMAHDSVKRADLCLRPEHFPAAWHDYTNFDRFIQSGREVALEHLDEIRALLKPGPLPHVKPNDNLVGGCVA